MKTTQQAQGGETKHTETPWTLDSNNSNMVFAPRMGGLIAKTYDNAGTGSDKCAEANAAFICLAVNSHQKLMEALEANTRMLQMVSDLLKDGPHYTKAAFVNEQIERNRAALASAKKGD